MVWEDQFFDLLKFKQGTKEKREEGERIFFAGKGERIVQLLRLTPLSKLEQQFNWYVCLFFLFRANA
jgi:hypothetical protein